MKPSLQLRIGQQLTMTPQLQQAIRLLQLPILELNAQLQQILDSNVMLEIEEPAEREIEIPGAEAGPSSEPADAGTGEDRGEFEYDPDESGVLPDEAADSQLWTEASTASRADPWSGEDRAAEVADTSGQSLREHLLWQLGMESFTPREVTIGETIIDGISDDGYLTEPLEGILATLPAEGGFTLAEVEQVLAGIQALDPAGVGARDLSECLRLQLRQLDAATPGLALATTIATSHLDLVAAGEHASLRRKLGVAEADLETALALVRACQPRPGAAIQPNTAEYVVPDVFVRKLDGKWVVEVNRSLAPRLRVNQAYAQMLRGNGEHGVLRTQLQEARWLVRSLEIRNDTLLKVANCIVRRQQEFFEHGEERMKPMILRDVATAVEMHESTISRITSGKYMHTPRGVFELRYFFSSQLGGEDGAEQSSTAIRARIRKLIGQENPASPLSDSRIAELLQADGVNVARRTVAKYREAMKIAPSSERRRRAAR
ncbi:MAG: RNA polymerase factor sigma-54 [Gammaproteobacteria bacterium]|nr:RNA polymerase factor sigma-54 [Gammaproteobacteria bacterium]